MNDISREVPDLPTLGALPLNRCTHHLICLETQRGRFPYKHSATQHNLLPAFLEDGLDLSYATLADKMKQANYSTTHHVGKVSGRR